MKASQAAEIYPATALLAPDDPHPVEWINAESKTPILLVCEHAGRAIPRTLGNLGISAAELQSHIGWDIGAASLARKLAEHLSAPLVMQRYSRLVIDCNRRPGAETSIPEISDGVTVPANQHLGTAELTARQTEIFAPFNTALAKGLKQHPRAAAFSIHSYTEVLGGERRPWHAGFLSRQDLRTATTLKKHLETTAPEMKFAVNAPYRIEDETDWFVPAYAEPLGLAHSLIEVRNDGLQTPEGVARWAELLAQALRPVTENAR